jgi:hypothetical protein
VALAGEEDDVVRLEVSDAVVQRVYRLRRRGDGARAVVALVDVDVAPGAGAGDVLARRDADAERQALERVGAAGGDRDVREVAEPLASVVPIPRTSAGKRALQPQLIPALARSGKGAFGSSTKTETL